MTFIESAKDSVGGAFRSAKDNLSNTLGLFRDVLTGAGQIAMGDVPTVGASEAGNIIGAISRNIGNEEFAPIVPPFQGGQCPGTRYNITGTYSYQFFDSSVPPSGACQQLQDSFANAIFHYGPIRAVFFERQPGQTESWQIKVSDNDVNGNPRTTVLGLITSSEECPDPQILTVNPTPLDGAPDDCGDPGIPIPAEQPEVVIVQPNFTYVDNSGDDINLGPIAIALGFAYVDIDADIKVPITVDVGGVTLDGTVNMNGDINFDFNFGGGRYRPIDGPGDIDIDFPLPEPADPVPTPEIPDFEETRYIVGVIATVTQLPVAGPSMIFQEENPDIYIPNLGYVSFLIQVSETSAAWTSDIPIKNLRNAIACPWPLGAIDVRGTATLGASINLEKVYRVRRDTPRFPVEVTTV